MTRARSLFLLATAALLISSCGKKPEQATTVTPAPTAPARAYDYQHTTLDNGMQVISLEDHSSPIVAVQVWYHVGSKDEKPDRHGFAHMFEHMMFRGTENIGPKAHFGYVHRVGGSNNAYTSFDNTTYIQEVPAAQLEMVLWLEAERMGFLKINQGYFDTERGVVAEEYRMGREQPYGTLIDKVLPQLFPGHPYSWSPIGDMDDLAAASVDELQEFWNTYYVPNNATLVVVGDVDHAKVEELAKKYFGWFPRYPDPPRPKIPAASQSEARKITLKENNGPAPLIALVYRTVATGHDDELALSMLSQILGQGESSRVYRDLVVDNELAMFAVAMGMSLEAEGIFAVGAVLSLLGSKPDEALAKIREQIALIQRDGVTADELAKAKNNALRAAVEGQLVIGSKAQVLGDAAVIKKDLAGVNSQFDDIRKVTAADITRVAKTYLVSARESEIRVEPNILGFLAKRLSGGDKGDDAPKPPDSDKISGSGSGKPGLVRPAYLGKTPPVGPTQTTKLAVDTSRRTLANGLEVVIIPNREVPFVSFNLGLEYGAYADPADMPGLASMAASMLTRGTVDKSYAALSSELDQHAIRIGGGAALDRGMVTASAVTDHADRAMDLLAQVVRSPTFPAKELEALVKQMRTGMAVSEKSPEYAAEKELRRRLFPGHPYRRLASGESDDLGKITSAALAAWWSAHCRPDSVVLYIAGDVSADDGFALAEKYFADWAATGGKPEVTLPALPAPAKTKIYLVDRKGEQSQIRVGQLGITRHHRAYVSARVLSEVFGGSFNARLNDRIRVKEGLTYGAGGGFRANRFAGRFVASTFTKNATVGRAVAAILDELGRLVTVPPTATEQGDAISYLLGSFVGNRETPQAIANDLWLIKTDGLAATYFDDYLTAVAKVTSADIVTAAKQLIDRDHLVIVVVGPADELKPQLEAIAEVEVVTN